MTDLATPIERTPFVGRILPVSLYGTGRARRIVQRNVLVYRRQWTYIVSGFFEPFFYLLSIGLGLNHLVGPLHVEGRLVPYPAFVAPGLLASASMNGAVLDSTFNIFFKLKIAKTYDAVLSTPMGVGDVARGELSWALIRGSLYSGAFICTMAALGYVITPWVVLCFPCAVLMSFAFAGAGMAGTSYMRSWQDFDFVSLTILPLFLFSATFFPLALYPGWLQAVVRCTPLYQGVALQRSIDLGVFSWALVGHIAYLVAMGVVGLRITAGRFAQLLLP